MWRFLVGNSRIVLFQPMYELKVLRKIILYIMDAWTSFPITWCRHLMLSSDVSCDVSSVWCVHHGTPFLLAVRVSRNQRSKVLLKMTILKKQFTRHFSYTGSTFLKVTKIHQGGWYKLNIKKSISFQAFSLMLLI